MHKGEADLPSPTSTDLATPTQMPFLNGRRRVWSIARLSAPNSAVTRVGYPILEETSKPVRFLRPICSSEWSPRWGSSLRSVRITAKDPPGRITSYSGNDGPRARIPDIELQDLEGGALGVLLRSSACDSAGCP